MNDEHGYQGPGEYVSTSKKSSPVKTALGIGCLCCLGLIIVVAGLFGWTYYHGKSELRPVAENFIRLSESGEYEAAYQEVGEDWKELQTYQQFENYYTKYIKALGHRKRSVSTGLRHFLSFISEAPPALDAPHA